MLLAQSAFAIHLCVLLLLSLLLLLLLLMLWQLFSSWDCALLAVHKL